ncbi:MAG: hypothetical protein AAGC53_19190 [Actinomycetota bacterium]
MLRRHGLLRCRLLGLVLALLGLVVALGFPASVFFATRGLVADLDRTPGLEVVDRDLRTLSLFFGSADDPAIVVVRVEGTEPAETLRQLLVERGFSSTWSPAPFHGDDGYYSRARPDSYDADLYRVLDENVEDGTVTLGLSFFDTDSMLFVPYAFLASLWLFWTAWPLLRDPIDPEESADRSSEAAYIDA